MNIKRQQRVRNGTSCVIARLPVRSPITPTRKELHWLSSKHRINCKITTKSHKVLEYRRTCLPLRRRSKQFNLFYTFVSWHSTFLRRTNKDDYRRSCFPFVFSGRLEYVTFERQNCTISCKLSRIKLKASYFGQFYLLSVHIRFSCYYNELHKFA